MIYVTHDQVEAMTLADRIVILNEGKIEQVGTPEEIYNNPDNIFVAQFIGTPKMNILEIKPEDVVSNKIIKILGNEIQFNKYNIEKKKYYIGIRPEHFDIDDHSEYEFSPKIDLVENLGNEKIVYMTKDKHQLSAKISSKSEIKNSFKFSFKNIFIFDENGERLRS